MEELIDNTEIVSMNEELKQVKEIKESNINIKTQSSQIIRVCFCVVYCCVSL